MKETKSPELVNSTAKSGYKVDETYAHDAFGMISVGIQNGGSKSLFGSDLEHSQVICLRISRATLERSLSNDWFNDKNIPMIEVHLSHNQFAEMITTPNTRGIPCTINYAPPVGTPTISMPSIKKIESKADTIRREIKNSAKEQLSGLQKEVNKMGEMLEAGTVSKKELKELHRSISILMGNLPSNMEFVVSQGEEALEKAVSSAKSDVEAYINTTINRLGVETARGLGLTHSSGQTFLEG